MGSGVSGSGRTLAFHSVRFWVPSTAPYKKRNKSKTSKMGMVHTSVTLAVGTEAGGSPEVQSQSGLYTETLSQKTKTNKEQKAMSH